MENRDMPEWLRVISIFVLTFALALTVAGLLGFRVQWVDAPEAGYGPDMSSVIGDGV